jgi:hypothetical protein
MQSGFTLSKGEEVCIRYNEEISQYFPICLCKVCKCNGKWDESKINWNYVLGGENASLFRDYIPFSNETYGETRPIFVTELVKHVKITKNDVFFDLGSGIGNVVMQISLDTGCLAVGIEKELARHEAALRLLEQCKNIEPGIHENVQLLCKDISQDDINLSQATVIYVANLCFDEQLQWKLLEHFSLLKKGTTIITLKSLFGQRNGYKKTRIETFLQQEFSIKGMIGCVSWTTNPINCFVYKKIA